ncbi:MAG: IS4 family transposase [Candidatus Zixiibacteriota bacterium]|nr:MAG: IS4 family transposase [candidate division Zixibacteria bacterium]
MFKNSIDISTGNSEKISQKLEQVTLNAVRKVLPDFSIMQACKSIGYTYRERKITPIITMLHMIMAAIWPEDSFNASWQVIWANFASWFPSLAGECPARTNVAQARDRLPIKLWRRLFDCVSLQSQRLSGQFDKWKEHRVVLADGTCVSISDKPELFRAFGTNDGYHGKGRYPLARLVTLCLANTMTVINYAIGRYNQAESTMLFSILDSLQKGDLLIADRHFAAAHFYWYYQQQGVEFITRAHQCLKISRVKRIHSYSRNDFIGSLNINNNYRLKDPRLPAHLMVRFIKATVRIRGQRKEIWFATSLLDNRKYPAQAIAELYIKRWRIETLFREVKVNFSSDVLRSQSPDGIRKEIIARLTAINIVRTIMMEAAVVKEVDPQRISFVGALRAIISFSPALASSSFWLLPQIYRAMLTGIASELVPERLGRIEPRMVRRQWQHYPSMKMTRTQWRLRYVA